MTPEELFRDPQVEYIGVVLRAEARSIVHKITVVFENSEISALNPAELEVLIKARVDKGKGQLAITILKSTP